MNDGTPDGRLPVWRALSEFFLDDELTGADYDRIAGQLALSAYSIHELDEILRFEVYPACKWNLMVAAGAWGDWGDDWIMEHIAPRKDKRPHGICRWFHRWLMQRQWDGVSRLTPWAEISRRVAQTRTQGPA